MKVYFVGAGYKGCYYVRCLLPLQAGGWWGSQESRFSERVSPQKMYEGAMAADIVVFHRPDQDTMVKAVKGLQMAGKKVVVDNDDTLLPNTGVPTTMYGNKEEEMLNTMNSNVYAALESADLVSASTDFLAEEYRKKNKNVATLPNCVDDLDWHTPKRNEGNKVRIGVVGSTMANDDAKHIEGLLKELSDREDVQLVALGLPPEKDENYKLSRKVYKDDMDFWAQFDLERTPWVKQQDYNDALNNLELDIMLIPRHDSYFNRCKSNLKFLEASMCEIPVIGQAFEDGKSPYQYKSDAPYLLTANTVGEWREQVAHLMDKKTRRDLGAAAHKYVVDKYHIDKNIHLWENAYKKLMK